MQFTSKILYFFLLTIVWSQAVNSLKGKSPDEAPGVVLLDSITFDKVVPSCTSNVMILFLDKRQIGQPTTDGSRDNFLEVSRDKDVDDKDLLFAQVMVNGAENAKLVFERLNITELPRLYLFPKGSETPIAFPPGVYINGINTRRFASKHTGTVYRTPSSLLDFDHRALQFVKATKAEQEELLSNAFVKIKKEIPDDADAPEEIKKRAETYLKTMAKIIEKGPSYVKEELDRLTSLITGKGKSDKKAKEFIERRDILYHFDFDIDLLFQLDKYDSSTGVGGVRPEL